MGVLFSRRHPPVDTEVKRLVELTEPLGRGDILTYEDIETCVGFGRVADTDRYQFNRCVAKWKRAVLESRGIAIGAVSTVGYRLMTVDEQLERAARKAACGARSDRQATRMVVLMKDSELDAAQASRKAAIAEHISTTYSARKLSYEKLKSLIVVPRALPRPPIPEE